MRYLRAALKDKLTDWEVESLPAGFDRIGHVAIISLMPGLMHRLPDIAQALLELKGIRTVALRGGSVGGRWREPQIKVVAGEQNTETIHREHGCEFKLDPARVMFSPGNFYERVRVTKLVVPGETVVDLFAGVGQFTIPIARLAKPSVVHSVEINPAAYHYLCENVRINRVGHLVRPLLGDCERVAPRGIADRVLMGILHVTHRYLPLALEVLKSKGGVIHYHESVPSRLRFERPVERLLEAVGEREVEILSKRVVKRYAPGVDHVVVDASVGPV